MSPLRKFAVDLAAVATLPIIAVWLYEVSNWVVLVIQGWTPSFSMSGWVPVGVVGVSSGSLSPLTKPFQTVIAVGVLIPLKMLFSKKGLLLAECLTVSTVGVYLASMYWESFSVFDGAPMILHVSIFLVGAGSLGVIFLRLFIRPEQIRRFELKASTNGRRPGSNEELRLDSATRR